MYQNLRFQRLYTFYNQQLKSDADRTKGATLRRFTNMSRVDEDRDRVQRLMDQRKLTMSTEPIMLQRVVENEVRMRSETPPAQPQQEQQQMQQKPEEQQQLSASGAANEAEATNKEEEEENKETEIVAMEVNIESEPLQVEENNIPIVNSVNETEPQLLNSIS